MLYVCSHLRQTQKPYKDYLNKC